MCPNKKAPRAVAGEALDTRGFVTLAHHPSPLSVKDITEQSQKISFIRTAAPLPGSESIYE